MGALMLLMVMLLMLLMVMLDVVLCGSLLRVAALVLSTSVR